MCIHIHLCSLLYTYTCTYLLVYIYALNYISHPPAHTHIYIYIIYDVIYSCIYTYLSNVFIYIYNLCVYIYICHMYLCLDNFKKNLPGECSIALSQTIGQSLQRSLTMAQEQKSRGAKNKRHQKTPVAQGRRDLLVYQVVIGLLIF